MAIYLAKRGQSTLEYAVVIAVIVGALLASSVYIKRGIQGRFKQSSDDIGEQFSPGASRYEYTTKNSVTSTETVVPGADHKARGGATTTTTTQEQDRYGTEQVSTYDDLNEYWGD
jgi:Flp pilus assembly pilin Flp